MVSVLQMKVKCPECKEGFELSVNDYEEGDSVECPECSESLIVKVKQGKFKLMTEKAKYYDEDIGEYEED
ncbi:MAG: sulfonate ABC transporter [Candidatus Diapherotrites archaeon]